MNRPITTPRLVRARLREAEAMVLRASGMGYEAIAQRLGYRSRASAYKAVLRGMEATRDRAAVILRAMMFLRYQGLMDELSSAVTARDVRRAMKVVEGPMAEAEWNVWLKAKLGGR